MIRTAREYRRASTIPGWAPAFRQEIGLRGAGANSEADPETVGDVRWMQKTALPPTNGAAAAATG